METSGYATWFRASTPYISAHRNRTFVVLLCGEAVAHPNLANIVHDLALLHVLGVRLVLVHGARPQIDAALPASRFWRIGAVLLGFGILIEVLQALPFIGRDASRGDILADACGIGAVFAPMILATWQKRTTF